MRACAPCAALPLLLIAMTLTGACGGVSPSTNDDSAAGADGSGHAGTAGAAGTTGKAGTTGSAGTTGAAGTTGSAGTPGSGSGPCFDGTCAGTCTGQSCNGAWVCDTTVVLCTSDIAPYCGCDGKTFMAGSSCPNRAWAFRGECGAGTSCDPNRVLCKVAAPTCPSGQVPSVSGSCYGPCVPIEMCACAAAADCPDANQYTCHVSAKHCGPFVN